MERFRPENYPVVDPDPSHSKIIYNFRFKEAIMIPVMGAGFAVGAFMFGKYDDRVDIAISFCNNFYEFETNMRINHPHEINFITTIYHHWRALLEPNRRR